MLGRWAGDVGVWREVTSESVGGDQFHIHRGHDPDGGCASGVEAADAYGGGGVEGSVASFGQPEKCLYLVA